MPDRFAIYPYREEEEVVGGQSVRVIRPTLDIDLHRSGLDWRTKALVDTGSPVTVLDHLSAEGLEINPLDPDLPHSSIEIGGEKRLITMAQVTLTLPDFPDLSWETSVGFFAREWAIPFGILGDRGFLDRWVVSFNRGKNHFVVEPVEDWEQPMPVDVFDEFQKLPDDWEHPGG